MIVDKQLTKKLPFQWEMWKTFTHFQSMKKSAEPNSINLWSTLCKRSKDAIAEAYILENKSKEQINDTLENP